MTVIIDDSESFPWADDVTGGHYYRARDVARSRVNLLRVVAHYSRRTPTEVDGGVSYKAACFFPSTVEGFAGTCAEQDASVGAPAENLSITRSDDDTHWRWRCFSCGRGQTRDGGRPGDVVDLVTHAEGFTINDGNTSSLKALRHTLDLVGLAGVLNGRDSLDEAKAVDLSLLVTDSSAHSKPKTVVPIDLALQLNRFAAGHWQAALTSSDAEHARTYLATRGVTDEQIERYAIGYARTKFLDLVPKFDARYAAVLQALNLARMTSTGRLGDAYIDRVVFPYCYPDRGSGRPLGIYGFAGRNLTGVDPRTAEDIADFAYKYGKPTKWTNSRNVDGVWSKSADLVGVWQAIARARELDRVGLCEGAFDMLALDRIDAPALAMVGKEVSIKHALLVRDVLGVATVSYAIDGDASGIRSVPKFVASFSAVGFPAEALTVIPSDDGFDPAGTPTDILRQRWETPQPAVEFLRTMLDQGRLELGDLRGMLAVAPWLASHFGQAAPERPAVVVADSFVLRALHEQPELAQHFAADEVGETLGNCWGWGAVASAAFGETTNVDALPRDVGRAWLRLRVDLLNQRVTSHEASAASVEREALRTWLEQRLALGQQLRRAREQLTQVNGQYH